MLGGNPWPHKGYKGIHNCLKGVNWNVYFSIVSANAQGIKLLCMIKLATHLMCAVLFFFRPLCMMGSLGNMLGNWAVQRTKGACML